MTSSTKPEVHNITTPPEENWATVMGNSQTKLAWSLSELCKRTERQTYSLQYLASLREGEVIIFSETLHLDDVRMYVIGTRKSDRVSDRCHATNYKTTE